MQAKNPWNRPAIEAKEYNAALFKNEAADLLYHFLILLKTKNTTLEEIELVLQNRGNLPRR
jgi:phosphoribosyl-ATP pyrophosphohydrolase/phosphoribosyl-AMP cyclohydrolase